MSCGLKYPQVQEIGYGQRLLIYSVSVISWVCLKNRNLCLKIGKHQKDWNIKLLVSFFKIENLAKYPLLISWLFSWSFSFSLDTDAGQYLSIWRYPVLAADPRGIANKYQYCCWDPFSCVFVYLSEISWNWSQICNNAPASTSWHWDHRPALPRLAFWLELWIRIYCRAKIYVSDIWLRQLFQYEDYSAWDWHQALNSNDFMWPCPEPW